MAEAALGERKEELAKMLKWDAGSRPEENVS